MANLTRCEFGKIIGGGTGALALSGSFLSDPPVGSPLESETHEGVKTLENRFGISLSYDPASGQYFVACFGELWFGTGMVSVLADNRWYQSSKTKYPEAAAYNPTGELVLQQLNSASQSDQFGRFNFLALTWELPSNKGRLVTEFRLYQDNPFLIFVQRFPDGFAKYASGNWIVPSVAFPQFVAGFGERSDLYSWTSGGMFTHTFGYGNASSLGGTVDLLLLTDSECKTVILSPFANYLVAVKTILAPFSYNVAWPKTRHPPSAFAAQVAGSHR
ncbi:MAG: hypothetical protein ACRD2B_06825 [Terriglobia bacterium]